MDALAVAAWEDLSPAVDFQWHRLPIGKPHEWVAPERIAVLHPAIIDCSGVADLARYGVAGIPLRRSAALLALAEEVASRLDCEPVEFSDEWVEKLADDFAKFDDD